MVVVTPGPRRPPPLPLPPPVARGTPSSLGASWPPLLVIHGGLDGVVASSNGQTAARAWADAAGARKGVVRRVQRGNYKATIS